MGRMSVCALFMCVFAVDGAEPSQDRCGALSFERAAQVKKLKSAFLGGDVKYLKQHIEFPIQGYLYDSITNIYEEELDWDWKGIATRTVISSVREASPCELVDMFGLRFDGGEMSITQMRFKLDKADRKYVHAGISSRKDLTELIERVNRYIAEQEWQQLALLLDYPLCTIDGLRINNVQAFVQNHSVIVDAHFKSLFKQALNEQNLYRRTNGVMLNEQGDIWIQQISGKLKVIVLNKSSKDQKK